jgi:predicted transcriptional regulator
MKKSLTPLGETEMEILHHVWELGEASVTDVQERILKNRKVAYTTVMTVMRNLNNKGYLKFRKVGLAYIYSPAKKPDDVRFNLVDGIVQKVFHGSPMALVQSLVENENISSDEREQIKKMIDKLED